MIFAFADHDLYLEQGSSNFFTQSPLIVGKCGTKLPPQGIDVVFPLKTGEEQRKKRSLRQQSFFRKIITYVVITKSGFISIQNFIVDNIGNSEIANCPLKTKNAPQFQQLLQSLL